MSRRLVQAASQAATRRRHSPGTADPSRRPLISLPAPAADSLGQRLAAASRGQACKTIGRQDRAMSGQLCDHGSRPHAGSPGGTGY